MRLLSPEYFFVSILEVEFKIKMKTIVRCPHCGEYSVDENTFFSFVPAEMGNRLRSLKEVPAAVIEFKTHCPRCTGPGMKTDEVRVLIIRE